MDSVFGIGLFEFAVIILLATIVLGPQRMRALARQLGKWTARLQAMTRAFTEQLNSELDEAEKAELKGAKEDIQQLRQQYADLRKEFINLARQTDSDVKNTIAPGMEALRDATRPGSGTSAAKTPEQEKSGNGQEEPEFRLPKPIDVPEDPES